MIQNIHGKLYVQSDLNGRMPNAAGSGPATATSIAEPQDRVTLSKKAQNAKNDHGTSDSKDEENLSSEEKQRVDALKRRDAEAPIKPSGPAKSEVPDLPGGYGPQWSQRPQPWKSNGRQINLHA